MVQLYFRPLLFLLWLVCSYTVYGQTSSVNEQKKTIFDLFEHNNDLKVVLEAQLDSLIIMKLRPFESKGQITFKTDTSEVQLPVKVSVRGKFRRRTCDFPPLLLDFPKDELKDLGLKKADDYKLVTNCLNKKDSENYLFREFLAY